ncbi:unnamed protein product, partial [Protopolystoma xenopodis]
WTVVSTSHRSYQHPQRDSNRDSAGRQLDTLTTRPHCHERLLGHCRGSSPAEGVDKTNARSKLQSTLYKNNFWECKDI